MGYPFDPVYREVPTAAEIRVPALREAPAAARRWLWGGLATLMAAMLVLAARVG